VASKYSIPLFIYQHKEWPKFTWDHEHVLSRLAEVNRQQGILLGKLYHQGFSPKLEASMEILSNDVISTSIIEGEALNRNEVRSSIAKRLGLSFAGMVPPSRDVEGIVEMMLDATQNYTEDISSEKLIGWHASLFPTGYSGMYKVLIGSWRDDSTGPMQVISGPIGREIVHFEAPAAKVLNKQMDQFIDWYNREDSLDKVLQAALAHLWFITLHPFNDGNGRIARALTDKKLAQAENSHFRFYSMSSQIKQEREAYYKILEQTQKGNLDISEWMLWFLDCLERAILNSETILAAVLKRARFWGLNKAQHFNKRQHKILDLLLDQFEGKLTAKKWAKINKCSHDTATRDINDLISKGILVKSPEGGRSTNYLLAEI